MEIQIETALLKAAMLATSKDEARYYLKGVYFELSGNHVRIVATDGHRMFVACQEMANPFENNVTMVLPFDGLKKSLTGLRSKDTFVSCQFGTLQSTINDVVMEPVDCTYPDYKRVVPQKLSGETAQFNPVYLGEMGKMAKCLGGALVNIAHNGQGPALVSFGRLDCFAVIMPIDRSRVEPALTADMVNDILGAKIMDMLKAA